MNTIDVGHGVGALGGFERGPAFDQRCGGAARSEDRQRRVLALVDLASRGEQVIRRAAALGLEGGGALLAVHVIDGHANFELDQPCDDKLAMALFGRGVPRAARRVDLMLARNNAGWAESAVLVGDNTDALAALIGRWKPDLIVTDRRSARAHWAAVALSAARCRIELIDLDRTSSLRPGRILEFLKGGDSMAAPDSAGVDSGRKRQLAKTGALGLATLLSYWLLFANESAVLELAGHGRWYFLLPIAIAFFFSFFHGAFTAQFWDVLGVKASGKKG